MSALPTETYGNNVCERVLEGGQPHCLMVVRLHAYPIHALALLCT